MRYIRKSGDFMTEYRGPAMGNSWYAARGYLPYAGTLPADRTDIVDGEVVELPPVPEAEPYSEWYLANPDLIPRVREYAAMLGELGLEPDSRTDDIALTINALPLEDSAKIAKILAMQTAFDNVVLNLEYLGVERPQYTAWARMSSLIAALPPETEADDD